jgi:hypothetical protein
MARVKRTKSGAVLTPEAKEELADEAEAGYDFEVATRGGSVNRPLVVAFRLDSTFGSSPDLAEALHERAEEEHRGIGAVARDALAS